MAKLNEACGVLFGLAGLVGMVLVALGWEPPKAVVTYAAFLAVFITGLSAGK